MLLVLKQLFAKNPIGRLIIIRGLRYSAMINNSKAATTISVVLRPTPIPSNICKND